MYRDKPSRWRHDAITGWICWHQAIGWLARAEFTLGLALALTDAGGAASQRDRLVDARREVMSLVIDVETVRACLTRAHCRANRRRVLAAPNGARRPCRLVLHEGTRADERLPAAARRVGASGRPEREDDLADSEVGPELARAFSGGGYTAAQRSALLALTWDHISSSLNGREESFELLSSGGIEAWTRRVQQSFSRYNELANAALGGAGVEMPMVDLHALQDLTLPGEPQHSQTA